MSDVVCAIFLYCLRAIVLLTKSNGSKISLKKIYKKIVSFPWNIYKH